MPANEEYYIKIELLSDLCVSDGGVYNCIVDTDICYDSYGLPYIPAKRLKGCLRECAQELKDWGEDIPISMIFGEKGQQGAKLQLRNAYLKERGNIISVLEQNRGSVLCHPQNVLNTFSYVRSQTSIDPETGSAQDDSLRTMRVANKGLVFLASARISEEYADAMKKCCAVLSHMGVSRTRGCGHVRAEWGKADSNVRIGESDRSESDGYVQEARHARADQLSYEIKLLEPVICKSVGGQEEDSMDYIEGAKVLGYTAQLLKEHGRDFLGFMQLGALKCSNAVLTKNGVRLHEVPACFYTAKGVDSFYCDKRIEKEESRQLSQIKHCYVHIRKDGRMETYDVDMEERYHHSRPEDKSIGRAREDGEGKFYQISSIREGQVFKGFITGSAEQIEILRGYIKESGELYLGYGRNTEYGHCKIRLLDDHPPGHDDSVSEEAEKKQPVSTVSVLLKSPAIVYNEKAFYSTDVHDLIREVCVALGIGQEDMAEVTGKRSLQQFINLTEVGGYQVTWRKRKPTIQAFDQGTVIQLQLKAPITLPAETLWLGERNAEGYGEAVVLELMADKAHNTYEFPIKEVGRGAARVPEAGKGAAFTPGADKSDILIKLAVRLFFDYCRTEAIWAANRLFEERIEAYTDYKPVISYMLSICRSYRNQEIDQIRQSIETRYGKKENQKDANKRDAKLKMAKAILEHSNQARKRAAEKFSQESGLTGYQPDADVEMVREVLAQLKYRIRMAERVK